VAHPDGTLDVAVIGAGVVGLAIARALALQGREVVVLESERAPGMHTSSRNSEVIHAGFYYPNGSLKARLCVAGRNALYAYAEQRGIAHRRVGKLVVATSEAELAVLEKYHAAGEANAVEGLSKLTATEARALEPEVRCVAALWSAETGIVDSHEFMQALRRDAEEHGAAVALRSPVVRGEVRDSGIELQVGGDAPSTIRCAAVVNSAGLWAQAVARSIAGVPAASIPPCFYARGHYFVLSGRSPFRHLVYPVAEAGGLGIHVTLGLDGRARFGPDVEWIDRVDYSFDEGRAAIFAAAIRRYWPALPGGALQPGYTGIRPKLGRAGSPTHDFAIQGPRDHGVPGLVNLYGIESPGLTAALAIGDAVAGKLSSRPGP
jgi:L-2-hydroxyglutarate oxidase LhgO